MEVKELFSFKDAWRSARDVRHFLSGSKMAIIHSEHGLMWLDDASSAQATVP